MTIKNYFSWRAEMQSAFSKEAADAKQLIHIIALQAGILGFDYYALYIRHPVPFTRPKTFFYSNYPQKWIDYYIRENLSQRDPVLCVRQPPGKVWVWGNETTGSDRQVFEAAKIYGIYTGISCTTLAENRVTGILSYSTASPDRSIELSPELELKLQCLTELALAALIRLKDISMVTVQLKLSHRELEILKWSAEGKTAAEISLILAISQNTVNFHQKNIQKRFNAPNKTQIASYAAAIGLI